MPGQLAAFAPFRPVFNDPIRQRPLKTYVATRFLGFDPFVFEDLVSFRLELAVERRVLQQVFSRKLLFRFIGHKQKKML